MEIINSSQFEEKTAEGLVLIDFYADWCGPCKMLAPELEKVSEELADQLKIYKVNVDDNMELARKFNVVSIPNLVLFKDGEPISQTMGFQPKDKLIEFINKEIQ